MVWFTDFCPNPEYKYNMGWTFVIQLLLYILVNVLTILWSHVRLIVLIIRKYTMIFTEWITMGKIKFASLRRTP